MREAFEKVILCIGAGYVGGPTMAVIARHCPTYKVVVADINPDRIAAWESEDLPVYEPGLDAIVRGVRGRNLFFTTDIPAGIRAADIIFVSVNTPTKTSGLGAGMAADLRYWEATARQILAHADRDTIVVEKSTLPVRTAEAMSRILQSGDSDVQFEVLSNPEFLAEGTAIEDLEHPSRVLIGSPDTPSGRAAQEALIRIYAHWVPRERILTSSVWSSELSKLVANAFLAQRISSINAVSAVCEATGADVTEVARAIGMDVRIGPHFLKAGVGFGGSCFKKDILNLVYIAEQHGLQPVADYWRQVVAINDYQADRFIAGIVSRMFNTIAGKRIAVLGFAFKADTGDTRESVAIRVCRGLAAEGAEVAITDPEALDNARRDLADAAGTFVFEDDPAVAADGAHAIVLLTDWQRFRQLDFAALHARMQKPAFVFDGRNLLDADTLRAIGFHVYPVGRPAQSGF